MKRELLARQATWVSRQKISQLDGKVVPQGDLDDILVSDPIRITAFDYQGHHIIAKLNHAPTPEWTKAFFEEGANAWTSMLHPSSVKFYGDTMRIPTEEAHASQAGGMARDWLKNTAQVYARQQRQAMERRKREEENRLTNELEKEKKRQEVLRKLNSVE